jgi:hypothetical protein
LCEPVWPAHAVATPLARTSEAAMPRISPRLIAAAAVCTALVALGAGTLMLTRDPGSRRDAGSPPMSAIEQPSAGSRPDDQARPVAQQSASLSAPSTGLAPCPSATATSCDRSHLPASAGAHGSSACAGSGTAMMGASPIDLNEIAFIEPMGLMIGGHVTPIDHGYIYIKGAREQPPRQAAVKSPLHGVVTSVARTVRHGPSGDYDDYALTIEATCTFRVRFSNLVKFAGRLQDHVGELQPGQQTAADYEVEEGELIGYTGLPTAYGIDVWVENDDVTLTGFVDPEQYARAEAWKLHMADLFDYTNEPLKSRLLALDMREASPRWGKIDYDIDGTLVGSWFRQGSGGYRGLQQGNEGYWDGHLSVVYDGNDPGQIVVSIGNYQGQPQQFAVIGNTPDPAGVSPAIGLVKYQLGQIVTYRSDTGQVWDHMSYIPHIRTRADAAVIGTVLMQMTAPRELKVEIFPGRTAADVAGFDSAALLYER